MHKSFAIGAAVTMGWIVLGATQACEPELADEATAAAAAVTTTAGPATSGAGAGGSGGGGAGGLGGAGGMGGDGGTGGAGGVHECAEASAIDRTGLANVTISDIDAWVIGHRACVRVDPGTVVRWEGDFGFHPLRGGIQPTTDSASPITGNVPANGATEVTFTQGGEFPYFCANHASSMFGVVFVTGGGGGGGGAGGSAGGGGAGGN